ncbi:MAG: endonuclease domain-containing protein [Deltaproteobacteria bacterium]|nr:endonuclease domain-containing protein [Deltaproteobacteria bacterium]
MTSFAKKLRSQSTDTENRLWYHLRAKRFSGLKFRRQEPIGDYIVDFVCYEKRLIIECDGGQHAEQTVEDQQRDQWFQKQGYKVLRFWNREVLTNTSEILERIYQACEGLKSPSP